MRRADRAQPGGAKELHVSHRTPSRRPLVFLFLLLLAPLAAPASPQSDTSIDALKALSVEQLMDLQVTSVSRRPEKLLEAPAAIRVITSDDIRRSSATTIANALRLLSSLDVAQENAHEWVVSSRGFSSDVGNKLLVLMDGRTLYTPLFSGVFWDRQDYLLEDIDRIEVISGPGGTLWGANAVNGVINITTRSAHDTQGLFVEAGAGTHLNTLVGARYGGMLGENTAWRAYGKYTARDEQLRFDGEDPNDAWRTAQGGFRMDMQGSGGDSFTLQGDRYAMHEGLVTGGDGIVTGSNLLGRWSRVFSETSDLSLQVYYDRTDLTLDVPGFLVFAPPGEMRDQLDTYDLDFQHRFVRGTHELVWGLGYRHTRDRLDNAPNLGFLPERLNQDLFSAFVQDEIALRDDLWLTLGTKLEHTDYTGFEVEPNVRVQWSLSERQSLWAAVSRAVRTPSRIDRDLSQPIPGFFIVLLRGDSDFDSEKLLAWEAGWRAQVEDRLWLSLATFYNQYDDLRSTSLSPPDPIFGLPLPLFFENNLEGTTWGLELNATFAPRPGWRLRGGYRLLREDIDIKRGEVDFNNGLNETNDPQQLVTLGSSIDLPGDVELDANLRWVDTRKMNDAGVRRSVPDYFALDLRVGWRPVRTLELSIVGQNLLDRAHPEFGVPGPARIEMERAVFGRIAWSY